MHKKLKSVLDTVSNGIFLLIMFLFAIGLGTVIGSAIILVLHWFCGMISYSTSIILIFCGITCVRIWFTDKPIR